MTVGIIGARTTIAEEFRKLVANHCTAEEDRLVPYRMPEVAVHHERYLFCAGFLAGAELSWMAEADRRKTMDANFLLVAEACDRILEKNSAARICVIGSESAYSGSFDMAYAGAKAALHLYIETKRLWAPHQQLVGIAPTIIMDSGMTQRRRDANAVAERAERHPKGRFLLAAEVARLAHFLLYEDQGYISGTVIRMHGGERK